MVAWGNHHQMDSHHDYTIKSSRPAAARLLGNPAFKRAFDDFYEVSRKQQLRQAATRLQASDVKGDPALTPRGLLKPSSPAGRAGWR